MIPAWLTIAMVTVVVAIACNRTLNAEDYRWFNRLRRPPWLTFERAIPLIWTVIFMGAAASASVTWAANPGNLQGWVLMGLYLLLELVTMAYTPLMCKQRSLLVGTIVGATGMAVSLFLAIAVYPVSLVAAGLLLPYILWSPIGTYTTWAMIRLNPADR